MGSVARQRYPPIDPGRQRLEICDIVVKNILRFGGCDNRRNRLVPGVEKRLERRFVIDRRAIRRAIGGCKPVNPPLVERHQPEARPATPAFPQQSSTTSCAKFVGENAFVDNDDGTITDTATGLMWDQNDSGNGMDWEEALAWPTGHGPQGDAIRIDNFVRLVRNTDAGDEGALSPSATDYAYLPVVLAVQ